MRKLFVEIFTWLAIEILLNITGLDDLGNYGEFIFAQKTINLINSTTIALII